MRGPCWSLIRSLSMGQTKTATLRLECEWQSAQSITSSLKIGSPNDMVSDLGVEGAMCACMFLMNVLAYVFLYWKMTEEAFT